MINEFEQKIIESCKPFQGLPVALSGGVDSSLLAALIKPRFVISVELPGDDKYNEIHHAKFVAESLELKHIIVKLDPTEFDEAMRKAVKAIGRPIPHFNIFPLYKMYEKLAEMGEEELVLGDGPDETMCGYARDLIFNYLYKVYDFEAFANYKPLIDKVLPKKPDAIKALTGLDGFDNMVAADIAMRKDMDDMSNGIAKHFGITNIRPYQDDPAMDDFMRDLPLLWKVKNVEFGKYLLRLIAGKYLPHEIAWRKKKVGGPVYPVNLQQGWSEIDGEFGKTQYLEYQESI